MRWSPIMRFRPGILIVACLLSLASPGRALSQDYPHRPGEGLLLQGAGELGPQSFEVISGCATPDQDCLDSRITAAPSLVSDGKTLTVSFKAGALVGRVLRERDPCANCVHEGFRIFLSQWRDYPDQRIVQVHANFDNGTVAGPPAGGTVALPIPAGAKAIQSIEIDFSSDELKKTLTWQYALDLNPAPPNSIDPLPAVLLFTGGAMLAAAGAALRRRRQRQQRRHQRANVSGALARVDGKPLAGIQVNLSNGGGNLTATSDASGQYRFSNVKPGTYQLSVQAPGFAHVQEEVDVTEGLDSDG